MHRLLGADPKPTIRGHFWDGGHGPDLEARVHYRAQQLLGAVASISHRPTVKSAAAECAPEALERAGQPRARSFLVRRTSDATQAGPVSKSTPMRVSRSAQLFIVPVLPAARSETRGTPPRPG